MIGKKGTSGWSGGGGGRSRGLFGKIFGDAENPLGWALPLYRWAGISVRVHLFFLVYIVFTLLRGLGSGSVGFGLTAVLLGSIFLLVLLHEYGHCFACRWVGGDADEVLLWPLGGLAMVAPPHDWRSHLITVLGGPGVNAALLLPLGGAAFWVTGSVGAVVFNPFDPGGAVSGLDLGSGVVYWLSITVWSLHYANMVLLAFNMLVPMYPMDAGRVVQALLWRRLGYGRSMEIAVVVGLVTAGVMAVGGIVFNEVLLLALAVFGGVVCWMERQRLRLRGGTGAGMGAVAGDFAEDWKRVRGSWNDEPVNARDERALEKRAAKAAAEQAEVDRILAKISETGMGSLTGREKRALKRASGESG